MRWMRFCASTTRITSEAPRRSVFDLRAADGQRVVFPGVCTLDDRVKHDDETIAKAEEMYIAGDGYFKIGTQLSVSPTTVRRWIVAADKAGRLSIRSGPAYDEDYRAEAIEYYKANEDMSIVECAFIHGVHETTMSRWLRNAGIEARTPEELRKYDHAEIEKRIEAGDKGVDIANDLGCSEALVSRIRRQMKEAERKEYDHKAIIKDLRDGMTGVAVSQKHGCSTALVSYIKAKNGL